MASHSDKPRVLVTGCRGFTGRYLWDELERSGFDVWGLTHPGGEVSARVLACDVRDSAAVRDTVARVKPQLVVHLAAVAFVAHDDVAEMYDVNVVGSRNLLAALAQQVPAPRCVMLVSSANVYGAADVDYIDESVVPAPLNDYAVSKLAMEYMSRIWSAELPILIVRPFNYTGIGQSPKFLVPKLIAALREREAVLELGNLSVVRDFSDVRWVVRTYRMLLELGGAIFNGRVLNVCSGVGASLQEILDMGSALCGHMPEIRVNPAYVRSNEVVKLVGSKGALDMILGQQPAVDLKETLSWMLDAEGGS